MKGEESINEIMEELEGLDILEQESGKMREDKERRKMLTVDLANRLCMEKIFGDKRQGRNG